MPWGLTPPDSAELKGPGKLLRIRPGIFNFEPELGLKLGQTKPKISGTVPTNRHTTVPNNSGPISACCDDGPKLLNCEIAQPRQEQAGTKRCRAMCSKFEVLRRRPTTFNPPLGTMLPAGAGKRPKSESERLGKARTHPDVWDATHLPLGWISPTPGPPGVKVLDPIVEEFGIFRFQGEPSQRSSGSYFKIRAGNRRFW